MIELMIAITIATVGVLSTAGFISRTLSVNRVVSDQFTANYLAMEGVEVVKNIIDVNVIKCLNGTTSWNEGLTDNKCYKIDYLTTDISLTSETTCPDGSVNPLLFDSANGTYNYDSGASTRFFRTVQINPVSSDEIQVNSIVKWTTRGGDPHYVNLEDHFFNWLCDN